MASPENVDNQVIFTGHPLLATVTFAVATVPSPTAQDLPGVVLPKNWWDRVMWRIVDGTGREVRVRKPQ